MKAEEYLKELGIDPDQLLVSGATNDRNLKAVDMAKIMTDFAAKEIDRRLPSDEEIENQSSIYAYHEMEFIAGANYVITKLKDN